MWLKNGSALVNPANLLRRESGTQHSNSSTKANSKLHTKKKKNFNNNVWLIADVPDRQPPFHIEALQELTKAWAKSQNEAEKLFGRG